MRGKTISDEPKEGESDIFLARLKKVIEVIKLTAKCLIRKYLVTKII